MAGDTIIPMFKAIIVIQLFFALSIVLISNAIPDSHNQAMDYVSKFSDVSTRVSMESVDNKFTSNLESQTKVPSYEIGALVYYSGNILIDLLLNFFFAIPEMLGLVIWGITSIFNINSFIIAQIQLFISVIVTAMYILGIIQLVTALRSGTSGIT